MQKVKRPILLQSIWSWYWTTICIIVIRTWCSSGLSDQFCSHSDALQLRFIIWMQKCYQRHKRGENEDTCNWQIWVSLMLNALFPYFIIPHFITPPPKEKKQLRKQLNYWSTATGSWAYHCCAIGLAHFFFCSKFRFQK